MSGFEVAGVVLGAFPIVLSALEKYRELATRLGLFYRIHLEYKKCRDDLNFHQISFTRQLRQLLLPLVVDDDKIRELLTSPGGDSWRDQSISNSLKGRLGDSHQLYLEYIHGIERVMGDISRELSVDSRAVQEQITVPVSNRPGRHGDPR